MDKKQYNSIWAGSLALLLLAGSCSKSDETAAPEPADGRIVVRALASDSGQAPSFDRFGLYIVQKAAEGSEALAGERLHANVEFTRSGDTYVSTPAIAFPGAKKLRFDLYAYAPYRETALEAGAVTLPTNRTTQPTRQPTCASPSGQTTLPSRATWRWSSTMR